MRKVFLALWALLLIGALVVLGNYLYLISTGQKETWYQPHNKTEAQNPKRQELDVENYSLPPKAAPALVEMMKLGAVDPAGFKTGAKQFLFRTDDGNIVCQINLGKGPLSDWVVPSTDSTGLPGVTCGMVKAVPLGKGTKECAKGRLSGETFSVGEGGANAGGCVPDGGGKLRKDAEYGDSDAQAAPNARMKIPAIQYGTRLQVGRYSCADDGENLVCADLPTGHGFRLGDEDYELY
ncbi:MAG: hypothetical protein Q4A71_03430 [Actinomycetaceae bacterium]|nr:hypothetical protein [Actinomycetaceae bacterium]